MKNFSNKLKSLRQEKGLTQEQLANQLFVSRTLITKYETGKVVPSKDNLEKIADYFNVDISLLFNNDDTLEVVLDKNKTNNNYKLINNVLIILTIVLLLTFVVVAFIPLITSFKYVYPIPPGQNTPNREYVTLSIVMSSLNNQNPIGLLTFLFCLINSGLGFTNLFITNNKYLLISHYILFFINLILIFLSVAFAISSYNIL